MLEKKSSGFIPSLDWLLIFLPIAIALRFIPSLEYPTALFIVSCLAIIPLAGLMGKGTEHLSEHLGPSAGGLLSATFGNAAEMIIAMFALSKGLEDFVKASFARSILGKLLLVRGMSLLFGGLKYKRQTFNKTASSMSATQLTLASAALLVPTYFTLSPARFPSKMAAGHHKKSKICRW